MRVLLVGAGRMALRHLAAIAPHADEVVVVDPRDDARQAALAQAGPARVTCRASLDEATLEGVDAAVLAATASGRLDRVRAVLAAGVPDLFVEKPFEQSRRASRALVDEIEAAGARAVCHYWMRLLPVADELRDADGELSLAVTGGAWGLGANGIHWLDLAVSVTGEPGALLWGELDSRPILSGRGPQFRDYGGRAVFGFGGSRLFLSSDPTSSAPYLALASAANRAYVLDLPMAHARRYARDAASTKPPYLYGADYAAADDPRPVEPGAEPLVAGWLRGVGGHGPGPALPTVREALAAHELLFDLLETGGGDEFPFT